MADEQHKNFVVIETWMESWRKTGVWETNTMEQAQCGNEYAQIE